MQCLSCRAFNPATNAFCEDCGASLHLTCSACGRANRIDVRFCGDCGQRLDAGAATALDSHLRALSISGGEYKRLTVLFADIHNSTSLIASMDPESAMRRIQPALDAMKRAVHRYDGLVNKVQGDGVMALFGAPNPHEDHAVRACLAALAMHDAVTRLHDPDLQIRVGLHTGEVVVQVVNNSLYQTYDAAGVAVHLANRLENSAEVGLTLISASTFAEASAFIEARSLGPRQIRGITEPIEVFALTGARPPVAGERFRRRAEPSPLIGRRAELAMLEAELSRTQQGDANATNVIGIIGDAGLGKSRISFEFVEACRRQDIRVYETRVLSHGHATPFQPVVELFRNVCGIQQADSVDTARQRIVAMLQARGDFTDFLPVLLDFLGLHDPAGAAVKLDPAARKHRLLAFVRQFVHARLNDETVVVLIEDLHWIDQASEEFVEALIDAAVGTKTLILLNFRPGYSAPWMQRSHCRQISLHPLPRTEALELLNGLLGDDPSLALLSRNIAERAQGNPFFLEELVRSLADRGDFEGDQGAYRLKGGIEVVPLPATIQTVLGARIDRLADPLRLVLQTAAVIGREVPLPILALVADLPEDQLSDALQQLRRAEMLYEMPLSKDTHTFRHPLIQDVAYHSLLQSRRRELHAKVARALSKCFTDRLDEYSSLIGFHLEQAGDLLQSAQAHARAAIWIGAKDPSQALRSWLKTRELLAGQPGSQTADTLRMIACGQAVNFGRWEGISEIEGTRYFEEAKQIALASGNVQANAMIHAGFGRFVAIRGSADEYVAKIREAVALSKQAHDPSLEVTMKAGLSHALRLAGLLVPALESNIEAVERAGDVNKLHRQMMGFDIEPWLTALRGQLLMMMGRHDDARPFLDRVIQMDTENINASDHMMPSVSYVEMAWAQGDILLAQFHAERAVAIAARTGTPYLQPYAMACRGLANIMAGRASAAVDDLVGALEFARRRRAGLEYEPRIVADLANAYLNKGDASMALRAAEDAIRISSVRHTRIAECLARIVRAQALARSGEKQSAKHELQRIQNLIQETGALIYGPIVSDLQAELAGGGRRSRSRRAADRSIGTSDAC